MNAKLINKGSEGELLLDGRLDSESAPGLEKILNELIPRFDVITLNLKSLVYTSSAGLRVLLKASQELHKTGKELYVSNVPDAVMEVFEITGFAGMLNFK